MNSVRLRQVVTAAMLALVAIASNSVVFAQEAAAAAGNRPVLHLFGAALGLGMVVIGAWKSSASAGPRPTPRSCRRWRIATMCGWRRSA